MAIYLAECFVVCGVCVLCAQGDYRPSISLWSFHDCDIICTSMPVQSGTEALLLAKRNNRTDVIAMIEKVKLGEDGCARGLEK